MTNSIQPGAAPGFQESQNGFAESQAGGADRGIPGLTPTKKKTSVTKFFVWLALIVGLCVAVAFGVVAVQRWQGMKIAPLKPSDGVSTQVPAGSGTGKTTSLAQDRKELAAAKAAEAALPVPAGASGVVPAIKGTDVGAGVARTGDAKPVAVTKTADSAGANKTTNASARIVTPEERKLDGAVLAFEPPTRKAAAPASDDAPPAGGFAGAKPEPLEQELKSSNLADSRATRRADISMLLKRGTMLPCAQNTEIVTGLPGMISCHLTRDVYSADGSTLLMEKGSEVTGEQRRGVVRGSNRIFALWSRIDTQNGVKVEINSPGTDALGATGILAWVDDHWWERFGSAILLSVIDDVVAGAMTQQSSQTVTFTNTSSAAQQMAAKALEATVNIPPTAYSYHGSVLQIYVARDIDFRGVYELRAQ